KCIALFKDLDYNDRMKSTGFTYFIFALLKILTPQYQYVYLTNHIKAELTAITEYNKLDISSELGRIYTCELKMKKINIIYPEFKGSMKEIDNKIEKFMDEYNKS